MIQGQIRTAIELENAELALAEVCLSYTAGDGLLELARAEVDRRLGLMSQAKALRSVYDDVAAERLQLGYAQT